MAFVTGVRAELTEREQRGWRWLWPGVGPLRGVSIPVQHVAITRQEEPQRYKDDQARTFIWPGVGPQPGIPAVQRVAITRQEQPDHPAPRVLASIQAAVAPVVHVPPVGAVFTRQEQPDHPGPEFCPAVIPPGSSGGFGAGLYGEGPYSTAEFGFQSSAIGVLELPWHPGPFVQGSAPFQAAAPVLVPPVTAIAITTQEQPYQPYTRLVPQPGAAATHVAPLVGASAFTTQQQPDQPLPQVSAGAPPQQGISPVGQVVTRQEQPDHPLPTARAGVIAAPPAQAPPLAAAALTTQEQPGHPLPSSWPGLPPVVANTFVVPGLVFTQQQQPDHPLPSAKPSLPPQPGVPPVYRALTTQEQPSHPLPSAWPGVPPRLPTPTPPTRNWVVTVQEMPGHPPAFLWSGVVPLFVPPVFVPPVTSVAITTQEQPYHPTPRLVPVPPTAIPPPAVGQPPPPTGPGDDIRRRKRKRHKPEGQPQLREAPRPPQPARSPPLYVPPLQIIPPRRDGIELLETWEQRRLELQQQRNLLIQMAARFHEENAAKKRKEDQDDEDDIADILGLMP